MFNTILNYDSIYNLIIWPIIMILMFFISNLFQAMYSNVNRVPNIPNYPAEPDFNYLGIGENRMLTIDNFRAELQFYQHGQVETRECHIRSLETNYNIDTDYRIGSRIPRVTGNIPVMTVELSCFGSDTIPRFNLTIKIDDTWYSLINVNMEMCNEGYGDIETTIGAELVPCNPESYETPEVEELYGHTWNGQTVSVSMKEDKDTDFEETNEIIATFRKLLGEI